MACPSHNNAPGGAAQGLPVTQQLPPATPTPGRVAPQPTADLRPTFDVGMKMERGGPSANSPLRQALGPCRR